MTFHHLKVALDRIKLLAVDKGLFGILGKQGISVVKALEEAGDPSSRHDLFGSQSDTDQNPINRN
jgi:hypothetical protein